LSSVSVCQSEESVVKKFIAVAAAIAAFGVVSAASAADLPRKAPAYSPPVMAPAFSWTGVYIGINGGWGWGDSTWTNRSNGINSGEFNVDGGLVGGTVGINYQFGSWVFGLESDLNASWIKGSQGGVFCGAPRSCQTENTWLGTARGRLGYAWDRWMLYATGGAAYGDLKMTPPAPDTFTARSTVGWTAGAGVEYAFAGPWSVKLEYLYVDLGKTACASITCSLAGGVDVDFKTSVIRGGINYRFTGF
jgi:outer membrane immunogenic protein